ncbi:ATP-binding protein [Cupriavidus respiraculi]|uniref:ATP-binding protein n=1 Tax=Cupriavidus respiraculi TaxID=195930 RepID=UPI001C97FC7D|nr:ATP-binding protein [Cupriavidus respiraculi]MBY4947040.1 ATP-binding protein [Cupriavidus respiraculi]
MAFAKAVRKKAKLRLALTGPSGSGKTLGALMIAKGIGGRIACIDTEHGSASLYSDVVDFDVMELAPPYTPERYIAAIKEAENAGYDVLIIDSTTHEWSGSGGVLELVDQVASAKFRGNSWSAWNELTPRHRAFIDAMLQSRMHIIATGRSKTETAQIEENGRKKVAKLGMKTEQRDGFEYEFTVVLDIVHDGHYAVASKDRTGLFRGDAKPISEDTGKALVGWLESGAEVKEPTHEPQPAGVYMDDAMLTLRECADIPSLQSAFASLWKAATPDQKAELKAAYDTRKTELEPQKEAA